MPDVCKGPGAALAVACGLLLASCADCGTNERPRAEPQRTVAPGEPSPLSDDEAVAEMRKELAAPPTGEPVSASALAATLPAQVGDFVAKEPVDERSVNLQNGGQVNSVRRKYEHLGQTLELEVVDTIHAPMARVIVAQMQDKDRSEGQRLFKGAVIQGHPGLVQWSNQGNLARAGVLLNDRLVLNVKVWPAESAKPATDVADQLSLDALLDLATEPAATE